MGILGEILVEKGLLKEGNNDHNYSSTNYLLNTFFKEHNIDEKSQDLYPTYYKNYGKNNGDANELLQSGAILRPEIMYVMDFHIGLARIYNDEDIEGLLDLTSNAQNSSNYIESEKWQYCFLGWGQSTYEPRYFLSDQGRYVSKNDIREAMSPDNDNQVEYEGHGYYYAARLTELVQNKIQQGAVRPNVMPGGKDNWHRLVAMSFIPQEQLTTLPYYCDSATEGLNTSEEEPIAIQVKNGNIFTMANGQAPNIHVDHLNGVHYDNRIANLRIATEQSNTKAARQYNVILWTLNLTQDIGAPIRVELSYDNSSKRTSLEYNIEGNSNFTGDINQCINCETKMVSNQELAGMHLTTANYEGRLFYGKTLRIVQTPVILGTYDGGEIVADSLQCAQYIMKYNSPEDVITSIQRPEGTPSKEQQKYSNNFVTWVSYATNHVCQMFLSKGTMNESVDGWGADEGLSAKKLRDFNHSSEGETIKKRETIAEIKQNIERIYRMDGEKKGDANANKKFYWTNNAALGRFVLCKYNPLRREYLDIQSQYFKGEKWYRGVYFANGVTANKFRSSNVIGIKLASEIPSDVMITNDIQGSVNGLEVKPNTRYCVMCSNYGRVASLKQNTVYARDEKGHFMKDENGKQIIESRNYTFEIHSSSYIVSYPSANFAEMESKQIRLNNNGYVIENAIEDIEDVEATGTSFEFHKLVYNSVHYDRMLEFYQRYEGACQPFIHHKNSDTSMYGMSNLELVSNYENSLFGSHFTCIGLFHIEKGKLTPVMVWPNINTKEYGTFKNFYERSENDLRLIFKDNIVDANQVVRIVNANSNLLPNDMIMNEGYIFRSCLTKDYHFLTTSPQEAAKNVVAIIWKDGNESKYDMKWWSTDENRTFLTEQEIDEFRKTHADFFEMPREVDYWVRNRNAHDLNESIRKIQNLMRRMK